MDQVDIEIELPLPPSTNHYWRFVPGAGRPLISRAGRIYRLAVKGTLAQQEVEGLDGRLAVEIDLYPPPGEIDIDNVLKALLDALQHGGLYANDGTIDDLHITRQPTIVPKGAVVVRVGRI